MEKSKHFERELKLIVDVDLQAAVRSYMEECVADWFYETGASSSGKYHPKFSQGVGGLVRHTKAVVMFAQELLRMNSYGYMKAEFKDYVYAACIIHDTAKYGLTGELDKSVYPEHAANAAKMFKEWCEKNFDFTPSPYLLDAVRSHMGQWSTHPEDKPFTTLDRCVHLADYMASRSFIDIPSITEEWEAVENPLPDDDSDLPF